MQSVREGRSDQNGEGVREGGRLWSGWNLSKKWVAEEKVKIRKKKTFLRCWLFFPQFDYPLMVDVDPDSQLICCPSDRLNFAPLGGGGGGVNPAPFQARSPLNNPETRTQRLQYPLVREYALNHMRESTIT